MNEDNASVNIVSAKVRLSRQLSRESFVDNIKIARISESFPASN